MKKIKKYIRTLLKHIVGIFLSMLVVVPFLMVLLNSLKPKGEAARMSLSLPKEWLFSNYAAVIKEADLLQGFFNSMLYALTATLIGVTVCSMASFVLSRRRTKLHNFIYYFFIIGLFFPVNYVTLVRVFNWFKLTSTRTGTILVFTSAMIPFCVFTIYSFIESVPQEMDEAAVIDGAGSLSLFFSIIFPMLKPVVATCFILQFMGVWNDFLTPLYLSSKSKLFPMTMSVYQFFGRNKSNWSYIFADIILTVIPVMIVYFLGQRYLLEGTTGGAVKE